MEFKLETFFFDTPIYSFEKIEDTDAPDFEALFSRGNTRNIEGYNPWGKVQSTFTITRNLVYNNLGFFGSGGYGSLTLRCKRYNDDFIFYIYWDATDMRMGKIGQFPTVADFHIGEVKQYSKVISNEKLKKLTRAIGLAANGVGIGSFVYLRRIFEHLIFEAYETGKTAGKLDESEFQRARMDRKIELLRDFLPAFLVDSKDMYSILSLGIHELDEKTCLAHFDTLRVGIEIILDEKLDEFRKKEKIENAKKKLADLKSNIKK